jgi:hypothetical protein
MNGVSDLLRHTAKILMSIAIFLAGAAIVLITIPSNANDHSTGPGAVTCASVTAIWVAPHSNPADGSNPTQRQEHYCEEALLSARFLSRTSALAFIPVGIAALIAGIYIRRRYGSTEDPNAGLVMGDF